MPHLLSTAVPWALIFRKKDHTWFSDFLEEVHRELGAVGTPGSPAGSSQSFSLLVQTKANRLAFSASKQKTRWCGFLCLEAVGLEPTQTEVEGFTVGQNSIFINVWQLLSIWKWSTCVQVFIISSWESLMILGSCCPICVPNWHKIYMLIQCMYIGIHVKRRFFHDNY